MFKKLGIGLGAEEKYRRAFEKGILLGDFAGAVKLFEDAAREFEKRRDVDGLHRAQANAKLYAYVTTGDLRLLAPLVDLLRKFSEIERIGSASETMPTADLIAELEARQVEANLQNLSQQGDPMILAAAHERARDRFASLLGKKLVTYAYQSSDSFTEAADSRYFWHQARAHWYRAQAKLAQDPAAAAEEVSQAVLACRRAGYTQGEQETTQYLSNLRITRTCWMCGREVQGQGIYFAYLPTAVMPYHVALLEKAKQDASTVATDQSGVVVCGVCQGLIDRRVQAIATRIAQEMAHPLERQVAELKQSLLQLAQRLQQLQQR